MKFTADCKIRICRAALLLFAASMPAQQVLAQAWKAVPLVTAASLAAGHQGGEGAQRIRSLVVSSSDANFLLMGTDVGGIYRSLNGGKSWQVCMVGWHSRGGNSFAIDPKNPDHVIGLGSNSGDWNSGSGPSPDGIYISGSRGASWKLVYPTTESNDGRNNSLAFDPASYDPAKRYCTVVYWLSRDKGLFKSTDAGLTWKQMSEDHGGGQLAVHPTKSYVYIGDATDAAHGFYKSTDGGATFRQISGKRVLALAVISTRPDNVYIGGPDKVDISTDAGETFQPAGAANGLRPDASIRNLVVDPQDPRNMVVNHGGAQWWESYTWYTTDGGQSWLPVTIDPSNFFLPINHEGDKLAFDPIHPHVVFGSTGSGCVTKSVDGGKTFCYSNDGENAVMDGASFNFSTVNPNVVGLPFQDFDAALSDDGGRTWTYLNPAGNDWGGYEYGGYAPNAKVMYTGDSQDWGKPPTLKLSTDSGSTWQIVKDSAGNKVTFAGSNVSYSDPTDQSVLFASNWRSADGGATWSRMSACDSVFTSSPIGARELYGKDGNKVCKSVDHGVTWTDVTPASSDSIGDVAYDQVRNRIYVAGNNDLHYFENGNWFVVSLPTDYRGNWHAVSVAVDPGNPSLVYTCGASDHYANDATVSASTDAGKTWVNLTVTKALRGGSQPGGPHEVAWVRVDPLTSDLWAAGECFGFWRISAASVIAYSSTAPVTPGDPSVVLPANP